MLITKKSRRTGPLSLFLIKKEVNIPLLGFAKPSDYESDQCY